MKTPFLSLPFLLLVACAGGDSTPTTSEGTPGAEVSDSAGPGAASRPVGAPADPHAGLDITKKGSVDTSKKLFNVAPPVAPQGSLPNFTTPEGWVEVQPTGSMRFKQFSIAGAEGESDALVVVASWPNGVGPVEINLDRWVSQTGSATLARDLAAEQRWTTEPDGYLVTHVHVEGEIKQADGMAADVIETDAGAILAAFVETHGSPAVWTVKITGPASIITAHKERYLAFIADL